MYKYVQNSKGAEGYTGEHLPPIPVFQASPLPRVNTIAIYKHILTVCIFKNTNGSLLFFSLHLIS